MICLSLLISASVLCRTVSVGAQSIPDVPPLASAIRVSSPNIRHEVTVTGLSGAVAPNSQLFLVTLDTGHYVTPKAASDGSFAAVLFAPRGSSILIKADPLGISSPRFFQGAPPLDDQVNDMTGLPGTVVTVEEPPESGAPHPFAGAGLINGFAVWRVEGVINKRDFSPGETIEVDGKFYVDTTSLENASEPRVRLDVSAVSLTDPQGNGNLAHNSYCSTILTPTGLPIERFARNLTGFFTAGVTAKLDRLDRTNGVAAFKISVPIPRDLRAGYYRPVLFTGLEGIPRQESTSARIAAFFNNAGRRSLVSAYPPIVKIGSAGQPRFYAALLVNNLSEGSRGTVAVEDRGRFGIASHIITSSETLLIPRVDPRTGLAFKYRLEPFALTIGVGDRGSAPNVPLLPFRFPSGRLTVRIRKPDGTVSVVGPAPFRQWRLIGPSNPRGFSMEGGGYVTDAYQLTTLDPAFDVMFTEEGAHTVTLEAEVEDRWGTVWRTGGRYELFIARPLVLDTGVLPGTPFEAGNSAHSGVTIVPPVPAQVEFRIRYAPNSDSNRQMELAISGKANRFGHFQPFDPPLQFHEPGEYRADVVASYRDSQGNLWMGSRTWGSAIAPTLSSIVAHGRRGIDDQQENRQRWFFRAQTGLTFGRGHVIIPYESGDVMWMEEPDSATPLVSFQDLDGSVAPSLRQVCCGPWSPESFQSLVALGEIPLFSARLDRKDPQFDPEGVDVWGYSYASVQRALVRVREIIGEAAAAPYWRFNDRYGAQAGSGANGDLPNDFKFQFGAAVLRGKLFNPSLYAVYGSLFVLVPDPDPRGGTRVFPPFQGNGGGPSGGPLFKLKGKEIDIFFHPTGTRPGSILERGNVASFAGQIGPTLASKVEIVVTSPSGRARTISGQANKIGYFYQPSSDFVVEEPGVWRVKVKVWYDEQTSAGQVTPPFPTGDVLGSREGEFFFYVVSRQSPQLELAQMPRFVRPAEGPITFSIVPPTGLSNVEMHHTTVMPGFVLEEGKTSNLTYIYDAVKLHRDFPNLDLMDADGFAGVDTITMSFLLAGTDASGTRQYFARQILLQGEELLAPAQSPISCQAAEGTLCVNRSRFDVKVRWRDSSSRSGVGRAVPLTPDTGYFWFFGEENVELVIKVLDACGLAGFQSFWVFAAGLTNLETEITVTDTYTGLIKTYFNPLGQAFRPILDTEAFKACAAGSTATASFSAPAWNEVLQEISDALALYAPSATALSPAACTPGPTRLCLSGGRFSAEAFWRTSAGVEGQGQAVALTGDTGYFSFFDPNNIEVVIKVLNACAFPGSPRFWVFAAGLTDVQVRLRVTDTQTGEVKEYVNPLGTPFGPIQDTDAFATCP